MAGERIITLEGKLFFAHKGVEKLLEGRTLLEALPYVERISGDMAVAHALAFSQAAEAIAGVAVPQRAAWLRALLLELERMTMHIHDLANIGGNGTGYTMLVAHGFRIKERLMQCAEAVFGNRFWRGYVVPGGVRADCSDTTIQEIAAIARGAAEEMGVLVGTGLQSDAFRERLETTGVLPRVTAIAYGAVGVGARASGLDIDARRDHSDSAYAILTPAIVTETAGDVYARFMVRVRELEVGAALIARIAREIPDGAHMVPCAPVHGFHVGVVESWRGEIATALIMRDGKIERCFPRDPSFCNWALFGELGPGNIVPDFPLCNKSLNLSYSGTDL